MRPGLWKEMPVTGVEVRVSPHMLAFSAACVWPQHMIVGPKAYRAIQWEVEGKHAWSSRDWRRLKRERRKFMARGPA